MDHKIVVAVNKALDAGVALNAAAHSAIGLAARVATEAPGGLEAFNLKDYVDADGNPHDCISALSLIVLRGSNGDLRKLRRSLREEGILCVDFTHQMTGDTYVEQLERSAATSEQDLQYYAVAALGPADEINPLTRRLSLWR